MSMLNVTRSIKGKLGLGFGLIFILICLLGSFSLSGINETSTATQRIYETNLTGLHKFSIVNVMVDGQITGSTRALVFSQPDTLSQIKASIKTNRERLQKNWDAYYQLISSDEERKAADRFMAQYNALTKTIDQLITLVENGQHEEAKLFYSNELQTALGSLFGAMDTLANIQVAAAKQSYQNALGSAQAARLQVFGAIAAALLLMIVTAILLTRMITKPLGRANSLVDAIADGRLDNTIDNPFKDEFGTMLKRLSNMQHRLATIVTEVRRNCDSVSTGTGEIASGNDELSSRTQEQAANLEETAASMEEMTSTVKQNADNAAQADQLAQGVRKQADEGGEIIGRAVSAMGEISESSRKITDIIGLIDDIAFQTNLLALNASVEAARAGEQGRGFAVVAEEVRNLAGRCATAARDIKELVTDSAAKVEEGSHQVELSGKTLDEIVTSVTRVSGIVSEIASASSEQSSGIEQVNLAVSQMDAMTQQNASLVEESAAASRSLEAQAEALKEQVAFFKTTTRQLESPPNISTARIDHKTAHPPIVPDASSATRQTKAAHNLPAGDDDEGDWAAF